MVTPNIVRRLFVALGLIPLLAATAPPSQKTGITAVLSPANATVGVTKVSITGTASAGKKVIDTSTFPDGSIHKFSVKASASGAYTDGPFVLPQLGTFHDVLQDDATGASTKISYNGVGDFSVAVDPASQTMRAGEQANFTVTFKSVSGFGGKVIPAVNLYKVPTAAASWSSLSVSVPPNGSASATLTIVTLIGTPPGTYSKIILQGTSGSVTHAIEPGIRLTVTGPKPNAITAAFSPANPIVGVTEVRIRGAASAGEWITDTSTFPDGTSHKFFIKATGSGAYTDGPFVLRELGTFHDVLQDDATGATTTISYHGLGDFKVAVDHASQAVARGEEASFLVTLTSLHGFNGNLVPSAPNASKLPGATASWSAPSVAVRSNDSTSARLTIKTAVSTPAGTCKITVQGTNGSVTHGSDISLTVK